AHRAPSGASEWAGIVIELDDAAGRDGVAKGPRVGADQVDVELLGVERAGEAVHAEARPRPQLLLRVEGDQVEERREEIAGREVLPPVALQLADGKRPRLLEAVLGALERERHVGVARSEPE